MNGKVMVRGDRDADVVDIARGRTDATWEERLEAFAQIFVEEILDDDGLQDFMEEVVKHHRPDLFNEEGEFLFWHDENCPQYELYWTLKSVTLQQLLFTMGTNLTKVP